MPRCDFCKKAAVANYQKLWMRWAITKGEYARTYTEAEGHANDSPDGDDNVHVCATHEEKWLEGEI